MAIEFLQWLKISPDKNWLDIGCGTGALSEAIEKYMNPSKISGVDPSEVFIEKARRKISVNQDLRVGNADNLPFDNRMFDVIVSGLALNFFPGIDHALAEMKRVARPGGIIAAYVWDYAGKMDFLRYFWDAACQIDPSSKDLDEGIRFPICNPENLSQEFLKAGLLEVESTFLDIETVFKDFDDYWNPFLGGQGPAPNFLQSLSTGSRNKLRDKIYARMNFEADGSLKMIGRAIAVKGLKEDQ